MRNFLRHFLVAVQFFTRIPVTGALARWMAFQPAMLAHALAHLPLVGAMVGALCAAMLVGVGWALPGGGQDAASWVAAVMATATGVWVTGAFHEDGLADLADGLGGSCERVRALQIMKDSRIGSFGAIATVLALLAKVGLLALLAGLDLALAATALVLAHVCSRWMPLWVCYRLPHVGDEDGSKSKPVAEHLRLITLLAGLGWPFLALACSYALMPAVPWMGAVAGCVLGGAWVKRLLHKRLQGYTGDGLGAVQQVAELGFYLGLLLALGIMQRAGM